MASKDNQTLQIFIISLTILVILLGAGLIWVNSNRKAAEARAKAAASKEDDARTAQRQLQEEANKYKIWMGFSEADAYETLQKSFDEDMQRFGETFEENSRFYRSLLENIFEENRKLSLSEVAAKEQVKDLKQRLLATEEQKEAQIAEILETQRKEREDAAAEQSRFEEFSRQINSDKNGIAAQLDQQREKYDELAAQHDATLKELNDKIAKLERFNEVLKSDRKEVDRFAQPADGVVRWVNQRNGTIWINIGEADHLRPQVTFSVYAGGEDDAVDAPRKGSIEVTRILSDHLAEARISNDEPTNPLMEGDKIYSQVWDRGRQVGFAITGIIDMDDDLRDDIDQLKSIIAINGGRVDAVPGENGTIDGQMTVDTRYLILGKHPDNPRQDAQRRAWSKMSDEADTLGIEPIALADFLRLMGWRAERRSVKLGASAPSGDFSDSSEQATDQKATEAADRFRPRHPQPSF